MSRSWGLVPVFSLSPSVESHIHFFRSGFTVSTILSTITR
jgi:hypothetical protein